MLSLVRGHGMQKEAFVEKQVALIAASTSFLDVYKNKVNVSEIFFPQCVEQRSMAGVMHCSVEQQGFYQICNFNASIPVHHVMHMMHYAR